MAGEPSVVDLALSVEHPPSVDQIDALVIILRSGWRPADIIDLLLDTRLALTATAPATADGLDTT